MTDAPALRPQSHTTTRLLESIVDVKVEPIPTVATAIIKGRMTLILGVAYTALGDPTDPAQRAERDYLCELLLLHEAGHVLYRHHARLGERDLQLFNICCDASIHYHWQSEALDALRGCIDGDIATFGSLQVQPMPAERAYAELRKRQGNNRPGDQPGGCGRPSQDEITEAYGEPQSPVEQARDDAATARQVEQIQAGIEEDLADPTTRTPTVAEQSPSQREQVQQIKAQINQGGEATGCSRAEAVISAVPAWVDELLQRLEDCCRVRSVRGRSYRRENRHEIPLLPGRARIEGRGANVFVDCSSSMDSEALMQMISGLTGSPLLADSLVWCFDTRPHGPCAASDLAGIQANVRLCGGGTRIRRSYQSVVQCGGLDEALPLVMFSDAGDARAGEWDPQASGETIYVFFQYGVKMPRVLSLPEMYQEDL